MLLLWQLLHAYSRLYPFKGILQNAKLTQLERLEVAGAKGDRLLPAGNKIHNASVMFLLNEFYGVHLRKEQWLV